MEIKTKKMGKEKYLLLKENEAITILSDSESDVAINIVCEDNTLFLNFLEDEEEEKECEV